MEKKICHSVWERTIWRLYWFQKEKGMVRSVDVARHWEFQTQRMPCGSYLEKGRFFSLWMRTSFSA